MKFTVAYPALVFASISSSAFAGDTDDKRQLCGNQQYTLFFSNQCNNAVPVKINGDTQWIDSNKCQTFNQAQQYDNIVNYSEWAFEGENNGIPNSLKCSNQGADYPCKRSGSLPDQACVIPIENCNVKFLLKYKKLVV